MHLRVSGTLQVDGVISADGVAAPETAYTGGGGSGGSIWIEAGSLAGSGQIHANGGASNNGSGGGGGGRIALYTDSLFAGSITAAGGPCAQAGSLAAIWPQTQEER